MLLIAAIIALAVTATVFAVAASEPSAEIEMSNLSLRQNAIIKYAVSVKNLPSGATVGVDVHRFGKTGDATFSEIAEIDGKEYYIFDVSDLSAAEMTVDVYARPYIEKSDGNRIYGAEKKSSVLEFVYKATGKIPGGNVLDADTQTMLYSMLAYGAAVQDYIGENLDRPADAQYYQVKVNEGVLANGDTSGLYLEGDRITVIANEKEDHKFLSWTNSLGNTVSTSSSYTTTVGTKNETYTAVYQKDHKDGF